MSGSRPAPMGATQQMLPPGQAWFDPNTGAPTNAAWQFFFSMFVRTGGISTPVGTVGGQIGLTAVAAQAAEALALAETAQALGMMDLLHVLDPVSATAIASGDDALALAMVAPEQQWSAGNVSRLGSGLTLADGALTATGSGSSGIYAPLATGETPGPVLLALPNGAPVMVRIA